MKVHNLNNQYISSKGLKISYNAEYKLKQADTKMITSLFRMGREHEDNQYVDILVLKNLGFRIKEKANPFFCIKEPFHLRKISDNKLNISAVYDGVEDAAHLKDDKVDIGIDYEEPGRVDEIINNFCFMRRLQKISYVARLLENYFVKAKGVPYPFGGEKDAVITRLMDKYADIVV